MTNKTICNNATAQYSNTRQLRTYLEPLCDSLDLDIIRFRVREGKDSATGKFPRRVRCDVRRGTPWKVDVRKIRHHVAFLSLPLAYLAH